MSEFPRTWAGPQWKTSPTDSRKTRQREKSRLAQAEQDAKADAKRRDGYRCRFPRCGCRKLGIRLESAHAVHKGAGGDPTGDRSTPQGLMTLCAHRHREGRVSRDKGTLRWVPLTDQGADGPVAWEVRFDSVIVPPGGGPGWLRVAEESSIGIQAGRFPVEFLDELAKMEV